MNIVRQTLAETYQLVSNTIDQWLLELNGDRKATFVKALNTFHVADMDYHENGMELVFFVHTKVGCMVCTLWYEEWESGPSIELHEQYEYRPTECADTIAIGDADGTLELTYDMVDMDD